MLIRELDPGRQAATISRIVRAHTNEIMCPSKKFDHPIRCAKIQNQKGCKLGASVQAIATTCAWKMSKVICAINNNAYKHATPRLKHDYSHNPHSHSERQDNRTKAGSMGPRGIEKQIRFSYEQILLTLGPAPLLPS